MMSISFSAAMLRRASPRRPSLVKLLAILTFLSVLSPTLGLQITYCSNQNTGSGSSPENYNFQSNGHCGDRCKGEYAFAVIKGLDCWCSNYIPAISVSEGSCNVDCPGYPFEQCGNPDEGLFAYYQLQIEPAGTLGPSPSKPRPTTSISSSIRSTPSTSWTPTPYASVTTVFGSVQTIIITPSAPPATTATVAAEVVPNPFWDNTGKVAGTFTGVALIIILIVIGLVFFLVRRARKQSEALALASTTGEEQSPDRGGTATPMMVDRRRSNLTLATAGLGGMTRGSSHDKSTHENTPASMSRRTSIPLVHDQRLNPAALWNSAHENGSHVSINTLRDDRDYTRPVLHVRNPDFD